VGVEACPHCRCRSRDGPRRREALSVLGGRPRPKDEEAPSEGALTLAVAERDSPVGVATTPSVRVRRRMLSHTTSDPARPRQLEPGGRWRATVGSAERSRTRTPPRLGATQTPAGLPSVCRSTVARPPTPGRMPTATMRRQRDERAAREVEVERSAIGLADERQHRQSTAHEHPPHQPRGWKSPSRCDDPQQHRRGTTGRRHGRCLAYHFSARPLAGPSARRGSVPSGQPVSMLDLNGNCRLSGRIAEDGPRPTASS
jgi:hypothetical protein